MSNFLSDSTPLPTGKTDQVPPSGPVTGPAAAHDWNSSMQALLELRDAIAAGQYQSIIESPTAAPSIAGKARFRLVGSEVQISASAGIYRQVLREKSLNAQDYGFLPSATSADNLTALNATYSAAKLSGADIFIPAGLYEVDLGPLADGGLTIDQAIKIVGEGKGKTIVRCGQAVTVASGLFHVRHGVDFECQDLSIVGPDVISGIVYGSGADSPDCYGIFHEGNNRGQTSGITLRNVLMTKWNTAVFAFHKADAADTVTGCVVALYDCELKSRKWPLRIFGGNRPVAELNCFNCLFGLDEDEYFIGAQGEYAPLYIRGEVSHELVNCRFTFSNKYGIYCDHADNRAVVARKAAIINCYFDREIVDPVPKAAHPFFPATWGTGTGINCGMQNNTTAKQLLILGGHYHSSIGISPSVPHTLVIGASFYGYRGGAGVDNNDGYLGPVTVTACSFYDPLGTGGFAHSIRREIAGGVNPHPTHDSNWCITNNNFYSVDGAGANIKIDGTDAADSHVAIEGNNFYAERCSANIYINGGKIDVRRNRWYKRGAGGGTVGLIAQALNEPVTLNFDDNEAYVSGVYPMFLDSAKHSLVVRGGRNRAFSGGEGFFLGASATNVTGQLRLFEGVGTAAFGAGTITIGTNGDTFRHTAASIPSYSDVWVANPVSGAHNAKMYHGASFKLVAETAFALRHGTGAANARILLRGAADKTIAAGSTIVVSFDAPLQAWVEVAGPVESAFINARDFGMSPAASAIDNVTALRTAYAKASAAGKRLYIPAGTYCLDQAQDVGAGILYMNGFTDIFGDGAGQTILNCTRTTPSTSSVAYYVAPGISPTFADIQLNGQQNLGEISPDGAKAEVTRCFLTPGGGEVITLNRVKADRWYTFWKGNTDVIGGAGSAIVITGSTIRARATVMGSQVGLVAAANYVHIYDSTIENSTNHFDTFNPVIMCHRGVSYRIHRMVCNHSPSAYAIYYAGAGNGNSNLYAEVVDCHFGPKVFHGVHLAGSGVPVIYRGGFNRCHGVGFLVGGPSIIEGVVFESPLTGHGSAIDDQKGYQGDVQVNNCTFGKEPWPIAWVCSAIYPVGARVQNDSGKAYECITAGTAAGCGGPTGTGCDITDGTVHWMYLTTLAETGYNYAVRRSNSKRWTFTNCSVFDCVANGYYFIATNGEPYKDSGSNPSPVTVFSDCHFHMAIGNAGSGFLASRGLWYFNDCHIWQTGGTAIEVTCAAGFTAPVLELNALHVHVATNQIIAYGSGGDIATVNINDIDAPSSNIWSIAAGDVANFTGTLRLASGIGCYSYTPDGAGAGRDLIEIRGNGQTLEITECGSPTITDLWMRGAAPGAWNNVFANGTEIHLRVKKAFSLGCTGNIMAAAGVRAIDSVVTLIYSNDAGKWLEVSSPVVFPTTVSGTAILHAGTVTVRTSDVKASSTVMLSRNTPSGTPGELSAPQACIVPAKSFVINSVSETDGSTINWWILN